MDFENPSSKLTLWSEKGNPNHKKQSHFDSTDFADHGYNNSSSSEFSCNNDPSSPGKERGRVTSKPFLYSVSLLSYPR